MILCRYGSTAGHRYHLRYHPPTHTHMSDFWIPQVTFYYFIFVLTFITKTLFIKLFIITSLQAGLTYSNTNPINSVTLPSPVLPIFPHTNISCLHKDANLLHFPCGNTNENEIIFQTLCGVIKVNV